MQDVTVYSAGPQCMRCKMTERALDKAGITYTEVDLRHDAAAHTYVTTVLGQSEAPVVVVATTSGTRHWAGFRPDEIAALTRPSRAIREGR